MLKLLLVRGGTFGNAGIVHQNVHPAKLLNHAIEGFLHFLQAGKIRADAQNFTLGILCLQFLHRFSCGGRRGSGDNDLCAFPQEGIGHRKTNAAAAAGNDGYFIF